MSGTVSDIFVKGMNLVGSVVFDTSMLKLNGEATLDYEVGGRCRLASAAFVDPVLIALGFNWLKVHPLPQNFF